MRNKKISKQAAAVVTGAGSGIGRAFALEIATRGGRVVCADINLDTAEQTAVLVRDNGGQAMASQCDVTALAAMEALASEAEAWLGGPVDLIINNAGVGAGGHRIGDIPIADWRWVIDVNLWGVIHGCHVFAPRMRETGRGGIINVASTASFAAAPTMGPYNVSKAAVLALSETLAAECAGTGVGVSALCPTFVQTNIMRDGRLSEPSSKLADNPMRWTGVAADRVACSALDGLDKGQFYVLPQFDARLIWVMKRYVPASYARSLGWINRIAAARADRAQQSIHTGSPQ